ncbi:MAG: hypothetical protein K8W52_19040 [Deltaproteobacteria bacterium]|nr:hypothetical protein [Deltaproteobacteria bacterium]
MRAAMLLLLLTACDPSDQIRVRFPAPGAAGAVRVYWVRTYQDHRYAGPTGAPLPLAGTEFDHTFTECCGTAVAYRRGDLGFLACVDRPDAGPEFVCGQLGDAAGPPVRATPAVASCAAVEAMIADVSIDLARCALVPLTR